MVVDEGGSDIKKYLRYGDNCCFLTFDSLLSSSSPDYDPYVEREKMRQMSFIPLKSFTEEDKYNSFGVIMSKKVGNENTDVMYYLKHRKNFTPKGKLFYKTTNSYNFRMILYENNLSVQDAVEETSDPENELSYCAVLRPTLIGNTKFYHL